MQPEPATVRTAVNELLADMFMACQSQPEALRQTIEIAAIVRGYPLERENNYAPGLIPLRAQAVLARAWRESAALKHLAALS